MAMATSIEAVLLKIKLRWPGHVSRTEDHRLPKVILYGGTSEKIQRHFERTHATCNIDYSHWRIQAVKRTNWQHTVYQTTTYFEVKRRANMEDKRIRRKNRDPSEVNTGQIMTCNGCGKTCVSRIGFIRHKHVYTRRRLPPPCIFVREVEP